MPTKTRHRTRRLGGCPSKATPEQLDRLADELGDWRKHTSKAAAARAAGVSMATLMRYQHVHPWLRTAWDTGRRFRYILRQQAVAARQAAKPPRPLPTRQMRLVCWYLVHRVKLGENVTDEHARSACARVNLSWEAWRAGCDRFPDLLPSVARKRARRLAYAVEHGSIQIGWTPPDPNNYRTAAKALGSFQQRRGTFLASIATHDRTHSSRRDNPWL